MDDPYIKLLKEGVGIAVAEPLCNRSVCV